MCLQEVYEDHYYDWYKRKLELHGNFILVTTYVTLFTIFRISWIIFKADWRSQGWVCLILQPTPS